MARKYYHADPPDSRSLEPLSEQDIIKILRSQDIVREVPINQAEYAVFLADLHSIFASQPTMGAIIGEGYIPPFVNSAQAIQILNLRALREGIKHKNKIRMYDESIMRQYKARGIILPLSPGEQLKLFRIIMTRHLWRLEDILKMPLGRWPATVPVGSWHTSREKYYQVFQKPLHSAAAAS